jgi:MFS family permease
LSVGLILAARHFVGVLRMATPVVLNRFVDRKTFCLATFALSAIALMTLPFLSAPNVLPTAVASVWALVGLWCFNNLMQYLGTIAFYSWLADLVPTRIRGRFFGIRERWLVAGEAAGAVVCGVFAEVWQARHPKPIHWVGYAIPAVLGAIVMLTALWPIIKMPKISKREIKPSTSMGILKPFGNRAFLLLLLFGCWFSFSNGLTQTLQFTYPKDVLGVSLWLMLAWQTGMRLGQIGVSPQLGSAADRFGNKPMMLFCLLLTAQGPLFYYFASPTSWWWITGAWIVWIAYAGLNIGLPSRSKSRIPPNTRIIWRSTTPVRVYATASTPS